METHKTASRLRDIADHLERNAVQDPFPSEEEMKRRWKQELKENFIQTMRRDPKFKNVNLEDLWSRVEKCITLDVKRIRAALLDDSRQSAE